ncbi:MAG: RnfABCDGE type electron transport complex subunit D [Desulfobacterales bacterium]|nr:RnfABCDGE type electron transport complex subunit D [Desulfobacterales bacterium]
MNTKLIVSPSPFIHNGDIILKRSCQTIFALLPALLAGFYYYGISAVAVVSLSVSTAMIWELIMNYLTKQPVTIGDGTAALIGLTFSMLLPATTPWWAVLIGTFFAIIVARGIFGGIGGNPFNPSLLALAVLLISWPDMFDFNEALLNYDFIYNMMDPLSAVKRFGSSGVSSFDMFNLLIGKQAGGIGSVSGIFLIIGGIYLIIRGFIRWEISLSFIIGIIITSFLFNISDPNKYAGPIIHILSGYTLIGVFFLATEDSSSPVNFIPMIIYGLCCGLMTVLIRNIGAHVDGIVFGILLMNLVQPLLDKIRPKTIGKVANNYE